MCYFLYGAVNKGVNQEDYDEISKEYSYHFQIGTKHDVKMSMLENADDFRITDGSCDCDTALGRHQSNHEDITELCHLLNDMRLIRDINCVYISKNWKLSVAPLVFMVVLFLLVPSLSGSVGILVPVGVLIALAAARIMYKKGMV